MKILVTGGSGFIGSHLIRRLAARGGQLGNFDLRAPGDPAQTPHWIAGSLLDSERLASVIAGFQPTHIVHRAADANMEGRSIADYPVNVQGVTNLLAALRHVPMMERLIVTSSQHVRRPGSPVTLDPREYAPHMSYGESKVATEELVRAAALAGCWTIIRPTNVWGMGHPYLVDGLWRLIHKGAYVHPMGDNVVRGYGFVDNVCWQIEGLLTAPAARVSGRMFYVGDQNERQIEWIDAFGIGLTGRKVRRVPRAAIKMLAHVGDVVHRFGANFPMHSARFSNLTTENRVPMDEIHALLGTPPTTWREAVVATCRELKTHYNRRR